MTESGLLTLFLFLHVGAAIVAFGPVFAFPIIGRLGSKEPMHSNFGVRVSETISERQVLPFAISLPFTGVALIYFAHINLADKSGWWLDIGIVLYAIAITIAVAIQRPAVRHLIELTAGGPPMGAGGTPPGAGAGAPMDGGGRPSGPPPQVLEAIGKVRRNGQLLVILIVLIVLIMVSKPQF